MNAAIYYPKRRGRALLTWLVMGCGPAWATEPPISLELPRGPVYVGQVLDGSFQIPSRPIPPRIVWPSLAGTELIPKGPESPGTAEEIRLSFLLIPGVPARF